MAKILLVDDDPQLIKMYTSRFEETEHEVEVAENGEEGLRKTREFKPDIILLDILMPKINGLEMLKELKKDEKTKSIPVILLTNVGTSEEDIQKGLGLGAITYMIKASYTSKEVTEKMEEILEATLHEEGKVPRTRVAIKKEFFHDE